MRFDASLFLRLGLAFAFIYVSVSAFLNPDAWIGFIPGFLGSILSRDYILYAHETVNLILGIWLLSGWKTFWAAVIAALSLAAIVLGNLGAFIIVFRDVGLFFAAVALAVLTKK